MPYPFASAPTTAEIVTRFGDAFGATVLHLEGLLIGPRGPEAIRCLGIEEEGEWLISEPLSNSDDDLVGWDKLRRLCSQLGVDAIDLQIPGLHMGLPEVP